MSKEELIEAKISRLEELRRYQSYYGPNTPYPVIVEINDLELELQELLKPGHTRPTRMTGKRKKEKSLWHFSQRTFDAVVTITFIGLMFLFGSIIFAAYVQTRQTTGDEAMVRADGNLAFAQAQATLRPTFTPTGDPNAPPAEAVAPADSSSLLPTPGGEPTQVPTLVPTLTPSATSVPTEAPTPTETLPPPPPPTEPPPPPQPAAVRTAPTATPAPPPEPTFPFIMAEQGNRAFQPTSYHVITIYVAVVSEGNIPIGDLKVIGDHVPSGMHAESGPSDWFWSVANCLDCGYVKQGNLKFEPGTFADGTWNIYLADGNGTPLSPTVPLSYSSDPEQWVWDFIIFRRVSG